MRYTDTATYRAFTDSLAIEIDRLEAEHERLANIKVHGGLVKRKKTPEEQRSFVSVTGRLKTKKAKLEKVKNLKLKAWDLLTILQDAEGTTWSEDEKATWHIELANYEGRGEKALRLRYNLPSTTSTHDCDIPELNEEIKNIQGRATDGKFMLQRIQTGKGGRHVYGMWMLRNAELGTFTALDDETRLAIGTGEITVGSLYTRLRRDIAEDLQRELAPSKVIGHYSAMNGTTRVGFIRIPSKDCDSAWHLDCVTKMGPTYSLRTQYIVDRLIVTLNERTTLTAADHSPNVAA